MKPQFWEKLICPSCVQYQKENQLIYEGNKLKCPSCGEIFGYNNGIPDLRKSWFDYDSLINKTTIVRDLNLIDLFMTKLLTPKQGLILDVGAGRRFKDYVSKYEDILRDKHYFALDIQYEKSLDLMIDAEVIPFRSKSIDAIMSFEMLEHTSRPYKVAEEFSRVLKKDGFVIATAPFLHSFHGKIDNFRFTWLGLAILFSEFKHIYIQPKSTWLETRQRCINPLYYSKPFNFYYRISRKLLGKTIESRRPLSWRQTDGHTLIATNFRIPEIK